MCLCFRRLCAGLIRCREQVSITGRSDGLLRPVNAKDFICVSMK